VVFGIVDPQIWLAFLACILGALGCMVYGLLHWTGKDKEKIVKSKTRNG
jgi:hypothetical protein